MSISDSSTCFGKFSVETEQANLLLICLALWNKVKDHNHKKQNITWTHAKKLVKSLMTFNTILRDNNLSVTQVENMKFNATYTTHI